MADQEKGASTANSKKKGPSVDEDFGKDFLSSWKSSKVGNDEIDFGMETVPINKKKSFDFGKLDDFELSGDFDKKLSSFKMDMPDLDFSSPVGKIEKSTKEVVPGKQESRQKFSFNFDFNELGRFDLDSSPQEREKNPSKITGGTLDQSFKPNGKQEARRNSVTSSDLCKDQKIQKSQDTDSMVTSRPDNLIGLKGSKMSTSDLECDDASRDDQTSVMQQIIINKEKKNENSSSEQYREQSKETCLTKPYVQESTQGFPLQTVSSESSAKEDKSQIRTGIASSDAVKLNSDKVQDNCMRLVDSSQSRSTSPENSIDSRSCQKTVAMELSDTSGDFHKNYQGIPSEISGGKQALSELNPGQKNVENASPSVFSRNTVPRMNNADDKKNSGLKLIQSSLQRDSMTVKSMPVKEKATAAQQLKSVSKLAGNASSSTSAFAQKQLAYIHNSKIKAVNMYASNEDREPKENQKQAEKRNFGILRSYEEGATKGLKVISGIERNHVSSDTSSFQLKTISLPQQTTVTNTAKSNIPNLVSSIAPVRSSKIVPVEMSVTSPKDDKASNISRLSISRMTKLNSNLQNSTILGEAKSLTSCEKALELPLSAASSMANPNVKECASLSTSLKRKTSEESTQDPDTINPLKRVMGSPTGRKPFEFSSKFQREMVTKASVTEMTETCHNESSGRYLTSNDPPKLGSLTDVEVSKDGKACDISRKACDISRLTISSQSPSSTVPIEAKAELITDPRTVSSFKRVMQSATRRKPFGLSPRTKNAMVPSTENPEACHSENRAEDLISNVPDLGSLTHIEIPVLMEKDGNVEKAETWSKELDEMCNMLRKQHEEAKDLMVRTLVTNNQLLMLNHPILEEKINALQRYANSLRSKEF